MKILFILPQIPYPPHSGGRIVTWNTVKRFAQASEVSVACLYHHPSELDGLQEVKKVCREVAAFPAYGKWSITPLVKSLLSTWPYKAHRFFNPEMFSYVQRLIRRERFDVIHAQNFYTTPYVTGKEPCLRIHYKENVEGNILLRYAEASSNPAVKLAAHLEGLRTRRFEVLACRKFDRVLTISPIDRDTLLAMDSSLSITHQRPGVDLCEYPFLEESMGPPTVVFTGTLSYYPNSKGVCEFLQNSWPLVRKRIPEAQCRIVGSNPPDAVRRFDGHDGISVLGRVERVQEHLHDAHVYFVPLRIGSGIRLKILEAMAAGRAIVSTPVGCEGLDVQKNEHLLVAEMGEPFAEAIINLLEDTSKRRTLRKTARQLVEEVYDWDRVISRQLELYQSLLEREAAASALPPK